MTKQAVLPLARVMEMEPDERDVEGNKNIEIIIYAPHFSIGAEAAANENAAFGCNTAAADDDAASDASDALDV